MKYIIYCIIAIVLVIGVSALDQLPNHPTSFDLKAGDNGCYVDGSYWMTGWGVPGAQGGYYGGLPYADFCLVWEPGCAAGTESAAVDLQFNGGSEKIIIRQLDGQSELDSFDVLVNGVIVGHYADSLVPTEDWVVSEFPVSDITGNQAVALVATDSAWPSCDPWGQIAVDYINVEPDTSVPEFGVIGGVAALIGALSVVFLMRKK
jgi:hypothetical protein